MLKRLLTLGIFCLISTMCFADNIPKPLPVDEAFTLSAFVDQSRQVTLFWDIAPGYYLYKSAIEITPANNSSINQLSPLTLPEGLPKKDVVHGDFRAYTDSLKVIVPLPHAVAGTISLKIHYQGCSSFGFCYPPVTKELSFDAKLLNAPQNVTSDIKGVGVHQHVSETDYASSVLASQHYLWIIISFIGLGLLLAFTPCVLPMVPILSSIILGYDNRLGTKKAFTLSLAYVLGMAIAYACAGMLVAMAGSSVQVALQKPWVTVAFSGLFILLALSLFGFFELKFSNRLNKRLHTWSNRHQGGTHVGVFFMGAISTLVISPCVSAPLVGVLAYIGDSGNVILGGVALLSMGIGMGLPLIAIGMSAGKLVPKSGPWMEAVKRFFGFLMLGLACWMLARNFLPNYVFNASANQDMFVVVKNMDQFNRQLSLAKAAKKDVLLDFYADWCTSCVIMDHRVFSKPEVKEALTKYVLLRVDVTQNNTFDAAIMKRYHIVAPPTVVVIPPGKDCDIAQHEIVGEVNKQQFLADLDNIHVDQGVQYCQSDT